MSAEQKVRDALRILRTEPMDRSIRQVLALLEAAVQEWDVEASNELYFMEQQGGDR